MTTLKQVVERVGPLDFRRGVRYILDVAEQLADVHSTGQLHRDVRPTNIVLNEIGRATLGPPYFLDDSRLPLIREQADLDWIFDAADCLAPEYATGMPKPDARADVYSLGCVFYFLFTGKAPLGGGSVSERLVRHQNHSRPDVLDARADVPQELARLCQQMMAKCRDDRPKPAAAVSGALCTWLDLRDA
jgi:serine/threonine protein kinase